MFINYSDSYFLIISLISINIVYGTSFENISVNDLSKKYNQLEKSNFLYGITKLLVDLNDQDNIDRLNNHNNNDNYNFNDTKQCITDLKLFLRDIRDPNQLWSKSLMDSFGTQPSSLLWGNNFWSTDRRYCTSLNDPFKIIIGKNSDNEQLLNFTSPYPVKYLVLIFDYNTTDFIKFDIQYKSYIHVGLCMPVSCHDKLIRNYANEYFGLKKFDLQSEVDIDMQIIGSKIPKFRLSFLLNTKVLLLVSIIILISILSILSEIVYRWHSKIKKLEKTGSNFGKSAAERAIMCFSMRDNFEKFFSCEPPKGFVTAISGMRFFVCLWITLFHAYYYSMSALNNMKFLMAIQHVFVFQPIFHAIFYVDSFFAISAFLLVYNFLKNNVNKETIKSNGFGANIKLFGKLVLHRYLRIVPVTAVVMIIADGVYDFLDMYSPLFMQPDSSLYCRETYWYNLLFINNFLPFREMCINWTWYLACEMQFFILFLALLFIYIKCKNAAQILYISLSMAFLVISFNSI